LREKRRLRSSIASTQLARIATSIVSSSATTSTCEGAPSITARLAEGRAGAEQSPARPRCRAARQPGLHRAERDRVHARDLLAAAHDHLAASAAHHRRLRGELAHRVRAHAVEERELSSTPLTRSGRFHASSIALRHRVVDRVNNARRDASVDRGPTEGPSIRRCVLIHDQHGAFLSAPNEHQRSHHGQKRNEGRLHERYRLVLGVCGALAWSAAQAQSVDCLRGRGAGEEERLHEVPSVSAKKEGPSFKETARKYKGKPDAEAALMKHLTTNPKIKVDGKEELHDALKTKNEPRSRTSIATSCRAERLPQWAGGRTCRQRCQTCSRVTLGAGVLLATC
jgi:cytochrome c